MFTWLVATALAMDPLSAEQQIPVPVAAPEPAPVAVEPIDPGHVCTADTDCFAVEPCSS